MDGTDTGLESGAKSVYYPILRHDAPTAEKFRLHKIQDSLNYIMNLIIASKE
jgi:hypothetical protein